MLGIFDRWARTRSSAITPELIAQCAPTELLASLGQASINAHGDR
jgi:hypothetical protein